MEFVVLQLALLVIFGSITAIIAHQRGRNAVGWFFIGIIAPGCLGLILVLVLPDLNKQKEVDDRDRREKRRLRELLAQERMKNQAFRGHTSARLDAHDQALGMETRSAGAAAELQAPPTAEALEDGLPAHNWYFASPGGSSEGPFSLDELRDSIEAGELEANTLVWHESLKDWLPASQSPLAKLL